MTTRQKLFFNLFLVSFFSLFFVNTTFSQLPDFIIESVSGPTLGRPGQIATVVVESRNQG